MCYRYPLQHLSDRSLGFGQGRNVWEGDVGLYVNICKPQPVFLFVILYKMNAVKIVLYRTDGIASETADLAESTLRSVTDSRKWLAPRAFATNLLRLIPTHLSKHSRLQVK